jgi:hypothetical protein
MINAVKGLLVFGVMALVLFGCATGRDFSAKESPRVIGRWQEVGSPAVVTFHADGRCDIAAGPSTVSGKYTVTGPASLRIDIVQQGGAVQQTIYKMTTSGEKMRLEDQEGTVNEYVRIK